MSDNKQISIPDIGDFNDVEVIEVLVSVGDEVQAEDAIISLESEKATIEVPSPESGVIEELLVKEGDLVSEGTPMMVLIVAAAADESAEEDNKEKASQEESSQQESSKEAEQSAASRRRCILW